MEGMAGCCKWSDTAIVVLSTCKTGNRIMQQRCQHHSLCPALYNSVRQSANMLTRDISAKTKNLSPEREYFRCRNIETRHATPKLHQFVSLSCDSKGQTKGVRHAYIDLGALGPGTKPTRSMFVVRIRKSGGRFSSYKDHWRTAYLH